MHYTTRSSILDKWCRPVAAHCCLAAACILLHLSPTATSSAADAAPSASLTLAWDASPSTNVVTYKLYYGTSSGNYTQVAPAGATTQATITGLTPGTTYFLAATASDAQGLESPFSNEIPFTVPAPAVPALSLLRSGTRSVVKWPTNYTGFSVQWSASPLGNWTTLTSTPKVSGTYFAYTNNTSSTQRYYRLKK